MIDTESRKIIKAREADIRRLRRAVSGLLNITLEGRPSDPRDANKWDSVQRSADIVLKATAQSGADKWAGSHQQRKNRCQQATKKSSTV